MPVIEPAEEWDDRLFTEPGSDFFGAWTWEGTILGQPRVSIDTSGGTTVFLDPPTARAFAAEIVRLCDEIEGDSL